MSPVPGQRSPEGAPTGRSLLGNPWREVSSMGNAGGFETEIKDGVEVVST